MARVPVIDNLSVLPDAGSSGRFNAAPSTQAAALPFEQMQQLGRAAQGAGDAAAKMAIDAQQEANRIRVVEATSAARSRALALQLDEKDGFTSQRGEAVLPTSRQSKKPLADEYVERYNADLQAIEGGLSNDAQRAMFREQGLGLMNTFRAAAMEHEAKEYSRYQVSLWAGDIKTRAERIAANYNKADIVDTEVSEIGKSVYQLGKLQGKAGTDIANDVLTVQSKVIREAIQFAVDKGDFSYASKLAEGYDGKLTADDRRGIDGIITTKMEETQVLDIASSTAAGFAAGGAAGTVRASGAAAPYAVALRSVGLPDVVVAGALANLEHESRFDPKRTGDGGTARGAAQWRHERAANFEKVTGVRPEDATPLQTARFIKWEFDNPEKAGMTAGQRDAILRARTPAEAAELFDKYYERSDGKSRSSRAAAASRYMGGAGSAPAVSLQEAMDLGEAEARARGLSPKAILETRNQIAQRYTVYEKTTKDQEEAAVSAAYDWLADNQGNLSRMPSAIRAAIPGEKMDSILSFADRLAKGDDSHDEGAWAGFRALSTGELRGMTVTEYTTRYRDKFDQSHFERGLELLLGAQGQPTQGGKGILSAAEVVKARAREWGVLPNEGMKATPMQSRAFGQLERDVDNKVRAWSRQNNGKEPPVEIVEQAVSQVMVDQAFAKAKVDVDWAFDPTKPYSEMTAAERRSAYVRVNGKDIYYSAMTAAEKTAASALLRANGIKPTDEALFRYYVEYKAGTSE